MKSKAEKINTIKALSLGEGWVRLLSVNEEKQPGVYEVEFNIHSDEGQNLSSGVYFYQLKAGSFNQTKKMILAE